MLMLNFLFLLVLGAASAQSAHYGSGPLDSHADQIRFPGLYPSSSSGALRAKAKSPIDLALPVPIARKELCFRSLYAHPERYEVWFEHPVVTRDALGVQVLLKDGIKRFGNGTEAYKVEYCYPQNEPERLSEEGLDDDVCPLREEEAATGIAAWKRGLHLPADGTSDRPIFDQESFLEGFIAPEERMPALELDQPENQEVHEPEEPFDPFGEADFDFFAAFEQGYPGQDGCDEHGCWERKIVTRPAPPEE